LNPDYRLQSVAFVEPQPTRFLRDQQNIDDIEGARPVKDRHASYQTKDILGSRGIEGCKPQPRHVKREREGSFKCSQLDYRDVTHQIFKTSRITNPLAPMYKHREEVSEGNFKVCDIGEVTGSKPNVLPPARKDERFLQTSLTTKDIDGCASNTKGLGNFHSRERRAFLKTNTISDIFGACPGSLKRGPVTERCLHPLMPTYQYPGRNELTNMNDAFGKKDRVQQKMLDRARAKDTLKKAAESSLVKIDKPASPAAPSLPQSAAAANES
jgi:hypothetical protein